MPIYYQQPVIEGAEGTMTGWHGGDDARYSPIIEGVEVDPFFWELWQLSDLNPFIVPGYFEIGGHVDTVTPDSGGNNLPSFQMRWDSEGVWRTTHSLQSGNSIFAGLASSTRPEDPTTMSFRVANEADFIGGIYTPRSYSGLSIVLLATQADPISVIYSSVTFGLSLGMIAIHAGAGFGGLGLARSSSQIIG